MAIHASFLRFQCFLSVVSCWSVVSKKIASSCAMPVDSMLPSINYVGVSPVIFRINLLLGSISKRDKKIAAVFIFPGMCAILKLSCSRKS